MLPQALEEMDQPDAQRKKADRQSDKNHVQHDEDLLYRRIARPSALPLSLVATAIDHDEPEETLC